MNVLHPTRLLNTAIPEGAWEAEVLDTGFSVRAKAVADGFKEHRPTVYLLHGMADSSSGWNLLLPVLQDKFNIVVFDMPWSATQGSFWPIHHSPGQWWQIALDLCPVPPNLVVGHSFGASVLMDWISHEVMHNQTCSPQAAIFISPFYKKNPEDFKWAVLEHYVNRFQNLLEQGLHARMSERGVAPDLLLAMAEKVRDRVSPLGWMEFFKLYLKSPQWPVSHFNLPIQLIAGDQDISVFMPDCEALYAQLPQGQLHVLRGCGHYCLLEQAAQVQSLVSQWLEQYTLRT